MRAASFGGGRVTQDLNENGESRVKWSPLTLDEVAAQAVLPLETSESLDYNLAWYRSRHPDDNERMNLIGDVMILKGEAGYQQEYRCTNCYGEEQWLFEQVSIEMMGEGEWQVVGVTTDITERKRAEETTRFLAEASRAVSHSFGYDATLEQVARLAVSSLADICLVDVAEGKGEVIRRASAHQHGLDEGLIQKLQASSPSDIDSPTPAAGVIRSGQTQYAPQFTENELRENTRDEEHARLIRDLGISSLLAVPMTARGRVLGAITLLRVESSPPFTERDRILAEDLAQQVALAVDNARVYSEQQEAEAQLRRVTENARCILWTAEVRERQEEWGEWFEWSELQIEEDAAQQVLPLDVSPGQTYAQAWVSCRHSEDVGSMDDRCHRAFLGGEREYRQEFRCMDRIGQEHWLLEQVTVLPLEPGRFRTVGVCIDITDQKRTEVALLERNRLMTFSAEIGSALTESTEMGMALRRCTEAMVRHLDAAFARIWTLNEAEGMLELRASSGMYTHTDGAHSRIPVGQFKIGKIALEKRSHLTNEVEDDPLVSDQDWAKREGMVAFAGYPLIVEGRVLGVSALFSRQPLTAFTLEALGAISDEIAVAIQRYRAEEEVRERAKELAEANRQKDEFLAMLAHELRNPLSPILSAVHILGVKGPEDPPLQRAREVIQRQVGHMSRMIEDLLEVSRITRGMITLQQERVDLRAVVEQASQALRPLIVERGQEIEVTLSGEPLTLLADPTRLDQVISNLLRNATKFTDRGGSIRVEAVREGGEAVLRIKDTGMGIDPDTLPRIFDLFTQADRSLDRSQGGLGIGLTMVKRLVEMHGGTVSAHSEGHGLGSEFVVRLPLITQAQPLSDVETPIEVAAIARSMRILIVDDRADAADSLAEVLDMEGHDVLASYDGPSALEVARVFRPDVILLDIGLPGMDGYEVARHLREHDEQNDILMIALTGYGEERDRQRAREAGFDDLLTKPVSLEILFERLSRAKP